MDHADLDSSIARVSEAALAMRTELDGLAAARAASLLDGSADAPDSAGHYGDLVMRWSAAVDELDALLIAKEAHSYGRTSRLGLSPRPFDRSGA